MYKLMCIDDHAEDLVDILTILHNKLSAEIIIAHTYAEALYHLTNDKFDAFIVDIELSNGRYTGIQLADIIRKNPCYTTTPIVFISMYSHYSRRLLSSIQNCAFLTKPVQSDKLAYIIGACLGIPEYIKQNQNCEPFLIPISTNQFVEVNPKDISFIELIHNELTIQYINGEKTIVKCMHGCFKQIIDHIHEHSIAYLKQIYRSIIVNIDQVKKIDLQGNIGTLWLFGDPIPKPIGSKFKQELSELL